MAPATKYGAKIVPCQPGTMRHGEVPGHHRVHREHQRRGQRGQVEVGPGVVPPLVVGALPADRGQRVDLLAASPLDLVPHGGDVGNQAEDEERGRDREVGRDREHVPDQRRLEVGPEIALVRVRQQPVEDPLPPDVDDREQRRGHDREHRHGLGGAVHRRAPRATGTGTGSPRSASPRARCRSRTRRW